MSSGGGDLPRVGEILRDKYELVRTLGEGGMAVVFEGRHKDSGQRVAVKVLAPELARDPEIVARFDREARAVGRLRTRHVAHVVEVSATNSGVPFIVMDFLDGRDLASELESRKSLPVEEAVDYILQTCAAMDEAHRAGIVHRDLKPANLFLTHDGHPEPDQNEHRVVKVLDFGISKLVGESSKLTGAGAVMGTVLYMSPEQVRSSTDVDQRADIWSLGVILFEALSGRPPFDGPGHQIAVAIVSEDAPDIRRFAPNVPKDLAIAIAHMLERDRDARVSSIHEAAEALAPFAAWDSLGVAALATLGKDLPPRGRAATAGKTMPLLKRTVPLGQRFSLPNSDGPGSARSSSRNPHHAETMKLGSGGVPTGGGDARAIATDPSRRRRQQHNGASAAAPPSRAATIAGAALGLVAACGVVFGLLALSQRTPPERLSSSSSSHSASVSTSSSSSVGFMATPSSTSSSSASSTSEAAPSTTSEPPRPPPTGITSTLTTAVTAAPSSSSGRGPRRSDAGVAPPSPTVNPTLL